MSDCEEELIGDYEAVAWVLGNMAAHCGFPADRDRGMAGMMLPLAERAMWYAEFQRLWQSYRSALSQPFGKDREEDAMITSRVDAAFQALDQLSKEG